MIKNKPEILSFLVFFYIFAPAPIFADQTPIGEREYKNHCAGCHGLDGQGNGVFVEFLNKKPPSLTTLARDSKGVFPFRKVYNTIYGTNRISAHGTEDMPIWGERYATDIIKEYGEFSTNHPQTVRCRILELVFYLANIQEQ
jgi:mono/diheme cytochrome c family protein